MKVKKIITALFILVMSLQLLPAKQAIRYFFIDNQMVEEISNINEKATKNFRLIDEDHCFLSDTDFLHHLFTVSDSVNYFHFAEAIPCIHSADVHTPPPNNFFA